MNRQTIRIGTRGSKLALTQAHMVRDGLLAAHSDLDADDIEIVVLKTTGDKVQDRPLMEIGGKGLFTKEIEDGLLAGRLNLAVHSMKDVATILPDGLVIPCCLEREDPRDGFISATGARLVDLPKGAVIGSAALRRAAQVKHLRSDFDVISFRGNVQTRLEKVRRGDVDGTFLAMAGLNRLGIADVVTEVVEPDLMLPAVAQGIIGLECHEDDERIKDLIAPLNNSDAFLAATCERALLRKLDGSCRTPIAAYASRDGDGLHLTARLIAPDGSVQLEHVGQAVLGENPVEVAQALGEAVGDKLLDRAMKEQGATFMETIREGS